MEKQTKQAVFLKGCFIRLHYDTKRAVFRRLLKEMRKNKALSIFIFRVTGTEIIFLVNTYLPETKAEIEEAFKLNSDQRAVIIESMYKWTKSNNRISIVAIDEYQIR